jgi:hypothetical protein
LWQGIVGRVETNCPPPLFAKISKPFPFSCKFSRKSPNSLHFREYKYNLCKNDNNLTCPWHLLLSCTLFCESLCKHFWEKFLQKSYVIKIFSQNSTLCFMLMTCFCLCQHFLIFVYFCKQFSWQCEMDRYCQKFPFGWLKFYKKILVQLPDTFSLEFLILYQWFFWLNQNELNININLLFWFFTKIYFSCSLTVICFIQALQY